MIRILNLSERGLNRRGIRKKAQVRGGHVVRIFGGDNRSSVQIRRQRNTVAHHCTCLKLENKKGDRDIDESARLRYNHNNDPKVRGRCCREGNGGIVSKHLNLLKSV